MTPRREPPRAGATHGSSLVEVMVSLLLFAVGVLGLVALQARSIQVATQTEDRSRAALLANELVTQMWANKSSVIDTATLEAWNERIADARVAGLPSGSGSVATDANGVTTITISWQAPGSAASAPASRYITQVSLP